MVSSLKNIKDEGGYRLVMWQYDACVGDCKQSLRQQEQTSYQEIPQEGVAASYWTDSA